MPGPDCRLGPRETGRLRIAGRVLSPDGRQKIEAEDDADLQDSLELGRRMAEKLLLQGAAEMIELSRNTQ